MKALTACPECGGPITLTEQVVMSVRRSGKNVGELGGRVAPLILCVRCSWAAMGMLA